MSTLPVNPQLYLAFLGVMAVMAVTPGPANLFAVATGMERGKGAALTAVAGMNLATLVWFGAAGLGLGALVAAFPQVFRLIAVLGALYVAWLGLKALYRAIRPARLLPALANQRPGSSALVDGFLVQIANPKAILFFTAVLPPFLDIQRAMPPQLSLFALGTLGLDGLAMSLYALGGATLAARMTRPSFQRGFSLMVGLLLLVAAGLITLRLFD